MEKKMNKPLISVIVPIYNVAPYVRECLDSVINQTYKNLQIILVNDGSTDESESIAREYLSDERIELVCTKNGGLSRARNTGLEKAIGEYIYFIDSDDYIDLRFLEEMVEIARKYKIELVCNDQIVYFDRHQQKLRAAILPVLLQPNQSNIHIGGAVWRCLFARSLLERSAVKFLEDKVYEDEGFLYMVFPFCEAFVRYCGKPYFYRQREESIMGRHRNFRSYDLLDVYEAIYCFYQKNDFLNKFQLPNHFLYECALGYKNEKEYLRNAKILSKRLNLPNPIPPLPKRLMQQVRVWCRQFICEGKKVK